MHEQTENSVRSQLRSRLRRRQRKIFRRDDDDDSDSEDEGSSSAAAATTQAPGAASSSSASVSSSPASASVAPTSSSSTSESASALPTALPIVVDPSSSPFPTAPASSSAAGESASASSSNSASTILLPASSFTRLPAQPRVSNEAASSPSSSMETRIAIGAGVTAGAVVLLGLLACFCLRRRYKRRVRQSQISEASSVHDEEQFLVRGALGPTSTWRPWRPWSTNNSARSRGAPSFVTNDDRDMMVANGMRPRSVQTQNTERGDRGWYSMFSGSERIVSALTFSTGRRRSEAPPVDSYYNEKSVPPMPQPARRDSRASSIISSISDNAPLSAQSPPQRRTTRFTESRFSHSDRTVSSVSNTETIDMFFNRELVREPQPAYQRTSSALEREYVTMPVGSRVRASAASSNGGLSMDSTLQPPPPVPKMPWKYGVGSLRSWLDEQRRSKQDMTRLP